jgi:hypothetical protein
MSNEQNPDKDPTKRAPIEGELMDEDLKQVTGGIYLQTNGYVPRPRRGVRGAEEQAPARP